MRTIVKILHIDEWGDIGGKMHSKTTVQLDDGLVASGYGIDFKVNDQVQVFHDDKWNQIKVRKGVSDEEKAEGNTSERPKTV